jgi:hypothetical protein
MASHSKFRVGDILECVKADQWYGTTIRPGQQVLMISHVADKAGYFTGQSNGKMFRGYDDCFKLHARPVPVLNGEPPKEPKAMPEDLAAFRDRLISVVRTHLHRDDVTDADSALLSDILGLLGMKTRVIRKIELITDDKE